MAYSTEQWNKAKFLFELGMSLREIEKETGISNGRISKKATKEGWQKEADKQSIKSDIIVLDKEKEALDKKKEALLPKIAALKDYEVTILDDLVNDKNGIKSFVLTTAALSLIRKNQMLTKNTKQITEYETTYSNEGRPLMKKPITIDVELSPNDLKALDEGIDKNAVSLEVGARYANSQINVTSTSAVQNKTSLSLSDFYSNEA